MSNNIRNYLARSDLAVSNTASTNMLVENAEHVLAAEREAAPELLSYVVPKMTPDGTCSLPDDLDPEPYDLKKTLNANGFDEKRAMRFVARMDALVEYIYRETGADWVGIYKKLKTAEGDALVKIAYRGKPSRAEFPLTETFARHSNNSTVGLSGLAVLVSSVRTHKEGGKPYYACDDDVQSELCVPIFSQTGGVSGIIDLESFKENHFDDEKIRVAAAAAVALAPHL